MVCTRTERERRSLRPAFVVHGRCPKLRLTGPPDVRATPSTWFARRFEAKLR